MKTDESPSSNGRKKEPNSSPPFLEIQIALKSIDPDDIKDDITDLSKKLEFLQETSGMVAMSGKLIVKTEEGIVGMDVHSKFFEKKDYKESLKTMFNEIAETFDQLPDHE
jgi:hypothetical protein